jgi:uncharacterized membrane protein
MDYLLNTVTNLSLEKIIYQLLGFICHQDKSILIVVSGDFIPLCSRCLGLHIGFFLTLVFLNRIIQRNVNLDKPINLFVIIFLISIAGIHWIFGALDLMEMNSLSRFITGFISGSGLYVFLYSLKYKAPKPKLSFSNRDKIIISCLLMVLLYSGSINSYEILLPAILILVVFNVSSVINSLLSIIIKNNRHHYLFHLNKEVKS